MLKAGAQFCATSVMVGSLAAVTTETQVPLPLALILAMPLVRRAEPEPGDLPIGIGSAAGRPIFAAGVVAVTTKPK